MRASPVASDRQAPRARRRAPAGAVAVAAVEAAAAGAVAADLAVLSVRGLGARPWKLAARSPTLGGIVPLRAAQACPPLLAGNAFGLALSLPVPLQITRGLRAVD